jgi:hypothetical protein
MFGLGVAGEIGRRPEVPPSAKANTLEETPVEETSAPQARTAKAPSAKDEISGGSGREDFTRPSGDEGGEPTGRRSINETNATSEMKRGIERENASADLLAKKGYKVQQNPDVPGGKKPDYRIEGRTFDNYAPTTDNPRGIVQGINAKVGSGQADRIVLNLSDSKAMPFQVRQALNDYGSKSLREVIVISQDGSVSRYP